MTIKARLFSILSLIILLLLGTIASQNVASYSNDQQTENSKTRYLSYLLADEFRQSSMDLTRLCRTYVATGEQKYWDEYWRIVNWRNGEVARPSNFDPDLYPGVKKKQSQIMAELNFSSAEFALLKQASDNSNALIATEDQAMKSIKEGRIVSGPNQSLPGETVEQFALRIVFDQAYHNEVTKIMTPVSKFFQRLDQRTAEVLEQSQQSAKFWLMLSMICQVLVAALVAVLAYFMLQKLFMPLQSAVGAMLNIGEGEGDLTKRLVERGNNELSALARGFNLFSSHIQTVIIELTKHIEQIASSSGQLSATAVSTDRALVQQQQGIEQVLVSLEQILPAVQEVAMNASKGVEQASLSDRAANKGLSVVAEVNDNIGLLESDIENASVVINKLAQDTEEIGSVLDVIRGIADQTNLLALNAAIEAARAGEQGRGFAVVADEVRTLAQRTQDSTAEIQQMIEKLQHGAKDAVDVMGYSKQRTEACVENSRQAGESLAEITNAVVAISDISQQIAAATEEQNATIADIRRNVDNINQQVESTASASQQTSSTSEYTSQLTGQIKTLIQQFKTQ